MTVISSVPPTPRGPLKQTGVSLWEQQIRDLDALALEAGGMDRSVLLRWAIDIAFPELRQRLTGTPTPAPVSADPS